MRVYEERFTFGKYDDVPLKDVPDGYLKWFVENFDDPDEDLLKGYYYPSPENVLLSEQN